MNAFTKVVIVAGITPATFSLSYESVVVTYSRLYFLDGVRVSTWHVSSPFSGSCSTSVHSQPPSCLGPLSAKVRRTDGTISSCGQGSEWRYWLEVPSGCRVIQQAPNAIIDVIQSAGLMRAPSRFFGSIENIERPQEGEKR